MSDGSLSQEEIDALLNSGGAASPAAASPVPDGGKLSDKEIDTIGEVANICMGTAATALFSLVNKKVEISTPVVKYSTWQELVADYAKPCVLIRITYTKGLNGSNILVLKEHDVKIITDLMMGGDGTNTDQELGEIHLSAISEAMNQMCGTIATSMATLLDEPTDIGFPLINSKYKKSFEIPEELCNGTDIVKVTLRLIVDDLIDSALIQLYPISIVKQILKQEDV